MGGATSCIETRRERLKHFSIEGLKIVQAKFISRNLLQKLHVVQEILKTLKKKTCIVGTFHTKRLNRIGTT